MPRLTLTRRRSLARGGMIAAAALALLVPAGLAQEAATPAGGTPTTDGPHPAHIHQGTCADLGGIVAPLTELADPTGTLERVGPATARGVIVARVDPNSDAAEKGLQRGDLIISVNRQPVTAPAQVLAQVEGARRSGRTSVLLLVKRGQAPEAFFGIDIAPR